MRCIAAFAVIAATVGLVPAPSWAHHCTDATLRAELIDDGDLPAGFIEDPELTGRVDVESALGTELTAQEQREAEELHCAYGRTWVDEESGTLASALVYELLSQKAAAEVLRGTADRAARLGYAGFDVPEVKDGRGYLLDFADPLSGEVVGERAMVVFRRGRLVFTVNLISAVADIATTRDLATAQAERAPKGASGPADDITAMEFVGRMSGSLLFLVALYLLVLAGVARARDKTGGVIFGGNNADDVGAPGDGVVDVSPVARRMRAGARLMFTTQIVGVSFLVPGVVPAFWPGSLLPAATGLILLCGPPWWLRRRRRRLDPDQRAVPRLFTGRRKVRVIFLNTVALLVVTASALVAGLTGVIVAKGESVLVPSESGDDLEIPAMAEAVPGVLVAVALVAVSVAFYRRGRRLAALDARELMERDERPIVLYLRSFTDDGTKIRSAATGRRSLVEQLSPRRYDRFEEVVAWELSRTGPVVALNPPGTALAPVGAARTTLRNEEWQPVIAEWMTQASLIVVNAPPGELTEGLRWELENLDARDLWSKTLFVCPPVPGQELRRRWAVFRPLLHESGVAGDELPVDPARVMVATTTASGEWTIAVANERTEWTYVAAIRALASRSALPPVRRVAPESSAAVPGRI